MSEARHSANMRAANLLGAVALELVGRVEQRTKRHPNETSSSMAALNVIGFYEGCSNNALSQALGLSHTATVRLVDKLEAAGLVVSERGEDKRSVCLSLTPAGRQRGQELVSERCRYLCTTLDILSPEDVAHLSRISEQLLRAMVDDVADAAHICRLCDETACASDHCPVHEKVLEIGATGD